MTVNYPRRSPHFLKLRVAVRPFVTPEPVTIGLSGGADSLALVAAALVEGQPVHAIVVDHQLQDGSGEIAETAAEQAKCWGAEAEVVRVTVSEEGGTEAAARAARYQALTAPGRPVWVAHTMDDQAETYLLGALRGNPSGMLPLSVQGAVPLIRPLLEVRRSDTRAACAELGVSPWNDPHNANLDFKRVGVRRRVIPLLDEVNGGPTVPALAQAAYRAALQADFVGSFAEVTTDVRELADMESAVRQASIAALLLDAGAPVKYAIVAAVEQLVVNWHGQGPVAIGGGRRLWRTAGQLVISPR